MRIVVFDHQRTHDLVGTSVLHLTEDRAGRLWISTNGGLTVLDDGRFRTYGTADGLPSRVVRATLERRDGSLWIATDTGLAVLADGVIRPRTDLAAGEVRALAETGDGTLWAATGDGLLGFRSNQGGNVSRHLGVADGLPAPIIRFLLVDHGGALWAGSDRGLARIEAGGAGAVQVFRAADGLGDDYVRALGEDSQGTIWIGTETVGLVRFRPNLDHGRGVWDRFGSAQAAMSAG